MIPRIPKAKWFGTLQKYWYVTVLEFMFDPRFFDTACPTREIPNNHRPPSYPNTCFDLNWECGVSRPTVGLRATHAQ